MESIEDKCEKIVCPVARECDQQFVKNNCTSGAYLECRRYNEIISNIKEYRQQLIR